MLKEILELIDRQRDIYTNFKLLGIWFKEKQKRLKDKLK